LILLSPKTYKFWNQRVFALKPINPSGDKKTFKVEFFWQKVPKSIAPTVNLLTKSPSTKGLEQYNGHDHKSNYKAWVSTSPDRKSIESGDCFDLETTDPHIMPLLNFQLLEMQWFL
jgi:hypothetical protein